MKIRKYQLLPNRNEKSKIERRLMDTASLRFGTVFKTYQVCTQYSDIQTTFKIIYHNT